MWIVVTLLVVCAIAIGAALVFPLPSLLQQQLSNAASLAQLIGVLLGVPTLWVLVRDQRKLVEDLTRVADIRLGFTQGEVPPQSGRVAALG